MRGLASRAWRLLRTLANRVAEVAVALTVPDRCPARQEPCILLSCHDVDRGLEEDGRLFSPILAPIGEHYRQRGREVVNLTHPLTIQRPGRVRGGAASINRGFVLASVVETLEAAVWGWERARARRTSRRVALYREVLRRTRPALVFSIQPPHELCIAARERGIRVVEAMHGMNLHPSDPIFRSTFEGVEDRRLAAVFLAFDSRTHATLASLLHGRDLRAVQVPHPWHVEVHREESRLVSGAAVLAARTGAYRAAILVTLQWGYDGERASLSDIVPNGVVHPSLEEAIASGPKDVLWLLRLHPIQMRRLRYGKHRRYVRQLAARHPNVEVTLASTLPLPLLLAKCRGHITMSSGSAGEAALLGVPSLMLCPTLKPGGVHAGWFSELSEAGMVTLGPLDGPAISRWVLGRMDGAGGIGPDWERQRLDLATALDGLLQGEANEPGGGSAREGESP